MASSDRSHTGRAIRRMLPRSRPAGIQPTPGKRTGRDGSAPPPRRKNYSWSELLKRLFEIDILVCERCGGPVRVIAAIQEPETAQQILNYLGLPSTPPPSTPARYERRFHPDDFAS